MKRRCVEGEWLAALAMCVAAAAASTTADRDAQHSRFLAESHAAMQKMMAAMDATPTGDVDADFATMMTAHHMGAIEMAQALLRSGGNEQLRRLAQEIIVTQQQEIAVMRLALTQHEKAVATADDAVSPGSVARQATSAGPGVGVSHRDRVYAAEQFSNTVSVTDPADNSLVGVMRLGDPTPGNLSPLYRGQLLVHGMGF